MTSTEFHGVTRVLGVPDGWKDTDEVICSPLYVRDGNLGPYAAVQSVWSLTDKERLAVMTGANISIVIIGETHPPVMLNVTDVKILDESPWVKT